MTQYEVATGNPQAHYEDYSWVHKMLGQENLRLQKEEAMKEGIMKIAFKMRSEGEPEDKIIRYTGYSFSDLDGHLW